MPKKFFLLIFSLCYIFPLFSQHNLQYLGLEEGLSQSTVNVIFKDSKGFIWVGTQNGLNRYDGISFQHFKPIHGDTTSISDQIVTNIKEDPKHRLWFATKSGLNIYQPESKSFKRIRFSQRYPKIPFADNINDVHFDTLNSEIWVGTTYGFHILDAETYQIKKSINPDNNKDVLSAYFISRIIQLNRTDYLLGTGQGLMKYNREKNQTTSYNQFAADPNRRFVVSKIIQISDHNYILISDKYGAYEFDSESETMKTFLSGFGYKELIFRDIVQDWLGNFWIATFNKGLLYVSKEGKILKTITENTDQKLSVPSNIINCLYLDKSGILWIGTYTNGLVKHLLVKSLFDSYTFNDDSPDRISGSSVWSFNETSDFIWVGTDIGLTGINKLTREKKSIPLKLDNFTVAVNQILPLNDKKLLIASSTHGLVVFDIKSGNVSYQAVTREGKTGAVNFSLNYIMRDSKSRFWLSTGNQGIVVLDSMFTVINRFVSGSDTTSLFGNSTMTIYEDLKHTIWIGSSFGISKYNERTGTFSRFRHDQNNPNSLSGSDVLSFLEDSKGRFWITTYGGGINLMDREKETFTSFTTRNGLPNDGTYGILEDENGTLWISTDFGLSHFDPDNLTFRNFKKSDGLQSNEFNNGSYFKSVSGELYFGGVNGFSFFVPELVGNKSSEFPVFISDMQINNHSLNYDLTLFDLDEIKLEHNQNNLVFRYNGLNYFSKSAMNYSYLLEGFNEEWSVPSSKAEATFTNLNPGQYTFRVRASSNNLIWNESLQKITITILPPWWKTIWAYLGYAALGTGFLLGFIGVRIENVKRTEREKSRIAQSELRAQAMELQARAAEYQVKAAEAQAKVIDADMRRKTEELERARTIQMDMLPDEDFQTEKFYVTGKMKTASEVGGDYYDFIKISETRFCVVIGDATGHGVSAGLVVGMIKMVLVSTFQNWSDQDSLDLVMQRINRSLKETIDTRGLGMCLTLCLIDEEKMEAEVCSSGMPFPIHYHSSEHFAESLELKGPPLGFVRNLTPEIRTLKLNANDKIVFYSDGFPERTTADDNIWGYEEFERVVRSLLEDRTINHAEFIEQAFDLSDQFGEKTRNMDDMTMVVIETT